MTVYESLFTLLECIIVGFESVSGSANGVSRAGIVLEEVRCNGTEERLGACSTSLLGVITNPSCTSAAAVTCSTGE